MIRAHDINAQQKINLSRIIKYVINHLASNNASVRHNAYMVLLTLYQQIGESIIPELGSARPSQIELLNKACKMVDVVEYEKVKDFLSQQFLH